MSEEKPTPQEIADGIRQIKALIDKLATERPYLVKAAEGEKKNDRKRDPGQGARTGTGNGSLEAGQDAYAARKAKRGGTTKTT
jgi:hypothetical protein